jgi:hypothetical protein
VVPVPIRAFLAGKTFDPETIAVLNEAFQGACADLGVTDKTPHARDTVAKKVIELADESNDPAAISQSSALGRAYANPPISSRTAVHP